MYRHIAVLYVPLDLTCPPCPLPQVALLQSRLTGQQQAAVDAALARLGQAHNLELTQLKVGHGFRESVFVCLCLFVIFFSCAVPVLATA